MTPSTLIETLASLIIKDGSISDALVFVPSSRAARRLERLLAVYYGGAVWLPKIVPLGSADDNGGRGGIGPLERSIALAKILTVGGMEADFSHAFDIAKELVALTDHLENEGIDVRAVDWRAVLSDEKKAAFLESVKNINWGGQTSICVRNEGIAAWEKRLADFAHVYCAGSTASVRQTRELMKKIAKMPNGTILFPGFLENLTNIGRTDPYWSIKRFVHELGVGLPETLTNGQCASSLVPFFNKCFSNDIAYSHVPAPRNITRIDCDSEGEEAAVVAAISATASDKGESVLIITPDASGEQRIRAALDCYGLDIDSSAGLPLSNEPCGRCALRLMDYFFGGDKKEVVAADLSKLCDISKLHEIKPCGTLADFMATAVDVLKFSVPALFWETVTELSEILERYDVELGAATGVLRERLKGTVLRGEMLDGAVKILGTAESRMMTADCVILTGLSDGIWPSAGFRHPWLSDSAAEKIGLPSPDSKVSLMALDFMTLSCEKNVYWTRSKTAGGKISHPSRFLSRVAVQTVVNQGSEILSSVRAFDAIAFVPLDKTPPSTPYHRVYYTTWLEDLIHNPYQFYAKHILHLHKNSDIGDDVGAREFGTLVHGVIEKAHGKSTAHIEKMLNCAAEKLIPQDGILFRFWQKRFAEMAPAIAELMGLPGESEKEIETDWFGRHLRARADRVESGRVIDYKTGGVPSNAQLGLSKDADCTMPQLPVEALILRETTGAETTMAFLRLQRGRVGLVEFNATETAHAIEAAEKKMKFLFAMDTYARPDHYLDERYRDFDDLCRYND